MKQLFNVTEKLIRDQKEISGIPKINWQQLLWQRTTLLTDKAVQFAAAKNYVFSHSVLCVGGTDQDQSFSERARKLAAENVDINDVDDSKCPYNLSISRANVPHLEKVCSNLRQQLKRKPVDKMEDLDVHTLIWRMFLIVTQQAAVHLGNDYVDNLHATKNSATKNSETILRCHKQVGWRTDRNSRDFPDRMTRKFLEKDGSVD